MEGERIRATRLVKFSFIIIAERRMNNRKLHDKIAR